MRTYHSIDPNDVDFLYHAKRQWVQEELTLIRSGTRPVFRFLMGQASGLALFSYYCGQPLEEVKAYLTLAAYSGVNIFEVKRSPQLCCYDPHSREEFPVLVTERQMGPRPGEDDSLTNPVTYQTCLELSLLLRLTPLRQRLLSYAEEDYTTRYVQVPDTEWFYLAALRLFCQGAEEEAQQRIARCLKAEARARKYAYQRMLCRLARALSALISGEEGLLNQHLTSALEEHRTCYLGKEFHNDPKGLISIPTLAVCQLARERGIAIAVEDPYLPLALLD